jgi:DNA-binding transcriptional MocR family regulator
MEQEKLYVLEDDADGEVVYDRKPFSTLFGDRAGGRIILTGTLDRFFAPALHLHYVVFPQEIMEIKTSVLSRLCREGCFSLLELEMLDLILSWERLPNHFRRYYYRNFLKRNHVIRCMEEAFGSCAVLHRTESGTEIIAAVPCTEEASVIMNRAAEAGLGLDARSGWERDSGQLYVRICYENISMEDIEEGIRILSGILGFRRSEI